MLWQRGLALIYKGRVERCRSNVGLRLEYKAAAINDAVHERSIDKGRELYQLLNTFR